MLIYVLAKLQSKYSAESPESITLQNVLETNAGTSLSELHTIKQPEIFAELDTRHESHNFRFGSQRLNDADRLLFTTLNYRDYEFYFAIDIIEDHHHARHSVFQTAEYRAQLATNLMELAKREVAFFEKQPEKKAHHAIKQTHNYGKLVRLNQKQEEVATPRQDGKIVILQGSAGVGKTICLMAWMEKILNTNETSVTYFTMQKTLARNIDRQISQSDNTQLQKCHILHLERLLELLRSHCPETQTHAAACTKSDLTIQDKHPTDLAFFTAWYQTQIKGHQGQRSIAAEKDITQFNLHQLYAEFTQVLITPSKNMSSAYLTTEMYQQLGKNQSYYAEAQREQVHQYFLNYIQYVQTNKETHYEPHLLFYKIFFWLKEDSASCAILNKRIGALCVDEMQLIHPWLWHCLLLLKIQHFIVAGDTHQQVGVQKRFVIGPMIDAFRTHKREAQLAALDENYRCEPAIALALRLLHCTDTHWWGISEKTEAAPPAVSDIAWRDEIQMCSYNEEFFKAVRANGDYLVILPDELLKMEGKNFGVNVLPVSHAGGTESKYIVCYGFGELYSNELSTLHEAAQDKHFDHEPLQSRNKNEHTTLTMNVRGVFRQLNLIIGRAQKNIFFVEKETSHSPHFIRALINEIKLHCHGASVAAESTQSHAALPATEAWTPQKWLDLAKQRVQENLIPQARKIVLSVNIWQSDHRVETFREKCKAISDINQLIEYASSIINHPTFSAITNHDIEKFSELLNEINCGKQSPKTTTLPTTPAKNKKTKQSRQPELAARESATPTAQPVIATIKKSTAPIQPPRDVTPQQDEQDKIINLLYKQSTLLPEVLKKFLKKYYDIPAASHAPKLTISDFIEWVLRAFISWEKNKESQSADPAEDNKIFACIFNEYLEFLLKIKASNSDDLDALISFTAMFTKLKSGVSVCFIDTNPQFAVLIDAFLKPDPRDFKKQQCVDDALERILKGAQFDIFRSQTPLNVGSKKSQETAELLLGEFFRSASDSLLKDRLHGPYSQFCRIFIQVLWCAPNSIEFLFCRSTLGTKQYQNVFARFLMTPISNLDTMGLCLILNLAPNAAHKLFQLISQNGVLSKALAEFLTTTSSLTTTPPSADAFPNLNMLLTFLTHQQTQYLLQSISTNPILLQAFAKALTLQDTIQTQRLSELQRIAFCIPDFIPPLFELIQKHFEESHYRLFAKALALQDSYKRSGLYIIAICAPDSIPALFELISTQVTLRESFAKALTLQNDGGQSGLQAIAEYAPDSMPELFKLIAAQPILRKAFAKALALHQNNETWSGLHAITLYASQCLSLLLDVTMWPAILTSFLSVIITPAALTGITPLDLFVIYRYDLLSQIKKLTTSPSFQHFYTQGMLQPRNPNQDIQLIMADAMRLNKWIDAAKHFIDCGTTTCIVKHAHLNAVYTRNIRFTLFKKYLEDRTRSTHTDNRGWMVQLFRSSQS